MSPEIFSQPISPQTTPVVCPVPGRLHGWKSLHKVAAMQRQKFLTLEVSNPFVRPSDFPDRPRQCLRGGMQFRHTLPHQRVEGREGKFLPKMLPSQPPNGVISLMTVSFADFLQSASIGLLGRACKDEYAPKREREKLESGE